MWMLPRCGGRTGQTINFTNWAGLFPVWKLSTGKLLLKITFFCRALFKKRACASVRKSLDMAWSIMGIMGNNFAQTTPLKLALENFPPFQNRCRKNQPMWWSFPDLIMTRSSAFLAILHHCRACTKRSRCPSLWGGRSSHSSAQTRYNYKDFFVVEILYLPVCACECQVTLQGEARLRVLSLYKAWRRHIPIMCKDFDIPRTEAQCQAALRSIWHPTTPHIASFYCYPQNINMQRTINMFWKEGVPEKCTSEGYSCDRHDHYQGISIQQCREAF